MIDCRLPTNSTGWLFLSSSLPFVDKRGAIECRPLEAPDMHTSPVTGSASLTHEVVALPQVKVVV